MFAIEGVQHMMKDKDKEGTDQTLCGLDELILPHYDHPFKIKHNVGLMNSWSYVASYWGSETVGSETYVIMD